MGITCRGSPQHVKRIRIKNTTDSETGLNVKSVSVLSNFEKGEVQDKTRGRGLRFGVEHLTNRSFEAVKISQGSN